MNIVAHNLTAMDAQRQLKITNDRKAKQMERLSSGYRINRSADDAAGLSISEKMRAQIRGLNKGEKNEQDGLSLMQVADGALTESLAMMHRLTELSIQSSNDTNTPEDRQQIQKEVAALLTELDRVAEETEFNTQKVFPQRTSSSIDGTPELFGPAITGGSLAISDKGSFARAGFTAGEQTIEADNSGVKIRNSTVAWDDTNLSSVIPDGGTLQVAFGNGIDMELSVAPGASVTDVTDMLNGATFQTAISQSVSTAVQGAMVDGVSNYDNGGYRWTFIDDPLNDAVVKDYAARNDIDLNTRPLSLDITGEFSFYPGQKKGFFKFSDGNELTFPMDMGAFNEWKGDRTTVAAGEEIPVTFKKSIGADTSTFQMSVIANNTEAIGNLFNPPDTNMTHRFTVKVAGVYSDASISDFSLGRGGGGGGVLNRPTKDWWIQTSSQAMEGFYIQTGAVDTLSLGINGIDVSTREGAQDAIDRVHRATEALAEEKGRIGAQENRLEHATRVNANTAENTQAAESRIRDQDMADGVVDYYKDNILENVGISMLAQANQSKQGVLSLLQSQG